MKIAVAGAGYVGLSNAVILSQKYDVCIVDPLKEKVDQINNRVSPIKDSEITHYFDTCHLNLEATTDEKRGYTNADYVIIAAPTNFSEDLKGFDLTIINDIIHKVLLFSNEATIIVRSTVPIGFTKDISASLSYENILFCPEFRKRSIGSFHSWLILHC